MRRFLIVVCCLLALFSAALAEENSELPVIRLTHVPGFSGQDYFEGTVQNCDDPTQYRITLYLKDSWDHYWIRPSAEEPTVTPDHNGHFTLNFHAGAENNTPKEYYLLLIGDDIFPGTQDYSGTKAVSICEVKVTRRADGEAVVTPETALVSDEPGDDPTSGEPQNGENTEDEPELVLTYVPAYGSFDYLDGFIRGCKDPTEYRVSLYLSFNGSYWWGKPFEERVYVEPGSNGAYTYNYHTGGSDYKATELRLFIIPADYSPDVHNIEATRAVALDEVVVTRTEDGGVTVSPDRYYHGRSLSYSPSRDRMLLDTGFYTDGGYPGQGLDTGLITALLDAIRDFTDGVRLYAASGELYPAYRLIHDRGFRVVFGSAYLCGDEAADRQELDALIEHCNSGYASCAVVGNETRLSNTLTEDQLLQYMAYVRERVDVPVTTSDSIDEIKNSPRLRDACDFLYVNIYPYWGGSSIDTAAGDLISAYQSLRKMARGKQIIISETAFPSGGEVRDSAVPSEENAARYFEEVWQWAMAGGVPICWFEAADENFKASEEGEVGKFWGILRSDLTLKPAYANTTFFGSLESDIVPVPVRFTAPGNDDVTEYVKKGETSELPQCLFTGPQNTYFKGWLIGNTLLNPGDEYAFQAATEVAALWCPVNAVRLPEGLTEIDEEAFSGSVIACVVVPEQCTRIGEKAFAQCQDLQIVELPRNIREIAADAFTGCEQVRILAAAESEGIRWAMEHHVAYAEVMTE